MTLKETLNKSLPLILLGACATPQATTFVDSPQINDLSVPKTVRDAYNVLTINANRSNRNPRTFSFGANFSVDDVTYEVTAVRNFDERSLKVKTFDGIHSFVYIDGFQNSPLDGIIDYAGLSYNTQDGHSVDSEFKFQEDFQLDFDRVCNLIGSSLKDHSVDVRYFSTN